MDDARTAMEAESCHSWHHVVSGRERGTYFAPLVPGRMQFRSSALKPCVKKLSAIEGKSPHQSFPCPQYMIRWRDNWSGPSRVGHRSVICEAVEYAAQWKRICDQGIRRALKIASTLWLAICICCCLDQDLYEIRGCWKEYRSGIIRPDSTK